MEESIQRLRQRALALLARREHSRRELQGKLQQREVSPEQLAQLLGELQAEGLQSDSRYAESLVRALVARGQGALRVRQTLKQKGVDDGLARAALEAAAVDWFAQAAAVRHKRFGMAPADSPKEYARQVRFLTYRGFDPEQVRFALQQARQEAALSD